MQHLFTDSTHLTGFDYDPGSKLVTVAFKSGRSYTHAGVPAEAIANFARYRSPGQFYHGVIKKYRLVEKTGISHGS